jgi:hypothetical protein
VSSNCYKIDIEIADKKIEREDLTLQNLRNEDLAIIHNIQLLYIGNYIAINISLDLSVFAINSPFELVGSLPFKLEMLYVELDYPCNKTLKRCDRLKNS